MSNLVEQLTRSSTFGALFVRIQSLQCNFFRFLELLLQVIVAECLLRILQNDLLCHIFAVVRPFVGAGSVRVFARQR